MILLLFCVHPNFSMPDCCGLWPFLELAVVHHVDTNCSFDKVWTDHALQTWQVNQPNIYSATSNPVVVFKHVIIAVANQTTQANECVSRMVAAQWSTAGSCLSSYMFVFAKLLCFRRNCNQQLYLYRIMLKETSVAKNCQSDGTKSLQQTCRGKWQNEWNKWSHAGLNRGPYGYWPYALANWAMRPSKWMYCRPQLRCSMAHSWRPLRTQKGGVMQLELARG